MLFIANIKKTTVYTGNYTQRSSTSESHIVDATDETDAQSKLNTYYTNLASGSISYEITYNSIYPTIQ